LRVRWSLLALSQLDAIQDYIAEENPLAAFNLVHHIWDRVNADLADHPEMGHVGLHVPDTRELVIADTPYIVVYQISDDAVNVVRVRHGAQLWPPEDADG